MIIYNRKMKEGVLLMCERKAIKDEDLDEVFEKAAKLVIEKNIIKGIPVAGYDPVTKRPFIEYPDGRKKYAEA